MLYILSANLKIWYGGFFGSPNKKNCAVSPFEVRNYEDLEVAIFVWDSDSGDIDIE